MKYLVVINNGTKRYKTHIFHDYPSAVKFSEVIGNIRDRTTQIIGVSDIVRLKRISGNTLESLLKRGFIVRIK